MEDYNFEIKGVTVITAEHEITMTQEEFKEELQKAFRAGHRFNGDMQLGVYAQDFDSWYKAIYK